MASINGTQYSDLLNGSSSADVIKGFGYGDEIYGNGGNDTIYGGTSVIVAPEDDDDGDDYLDGGAGDDKLFGGVGDDLLVGGTGNDRLTGGDGGDTLLTGDGNDVVVIERFADGESYYSNYDTVLDFSRAFDRIDVSSLNISSFDTIRHLLTSTGSGDATLSYTFGSYVEQTTFLGVAPFRLSASNFVLSNVAADDVLDGTSSSDDLFGGLGNDTLTGLEGNDRLFGEAGNDTLIGDADEATEAYSADLLVGGVGNDRLFGNGGYDRLNGGSGDDVLDGGSDDDKLVTGSGSDTVVYAPHEYGETDIVRDFDVASDKIDLRAFNISSMATVNDLLSVNSDGDTVLSIEGDGISTDLILANVDRSTLGASNFVFDLVVQSERITGSDYDDDLFGALGNDTLTGGDANDRLYGEDGNDILQGGVGTTVADKSLYDGDDILIGGTGDDSLYGGGGNDVLRGGDGADKLFGQNGDDSLYGGAGDDTFVMRKLTASETDTIFDFEAPSFDSETNTAHGDRIDLSAFGIGSIEALDEILSIDEDGNAVIEITSNGYAQRLVIAGASPDELDVSSFVFSASTANNSVTGKTSTDDLFGGGGNDTLKGGEGGDRLFGEEGSDILYGGATTKAVTEADGGSDLLYGGAGDDTLYGGGGSDILRGGDGADRLFGNLGEDTLLGGGGADSFVFDRATSSGFSSDTILDFRVADGDLIDLSIIDAVASSTTTNETFTYIEGARFTGAGQVRLSRDGIYTVIEGSVDKDASAEFEIRIAGRPAIDAGDFIL